MSFPPVSAVKPVDTQHLISETPFLAPASGPVEVPVAVDASVKPKTVDQKDKKRSHKSKKDKPADKPIKTDSKQDKKRDSKVDKKRDRSASPVSPKPTQKQKQRRSFFPPADTSSGLLNSWAFLKGTIFSPPQVRIGLLLVPPVRLQPQIFNPVRNKCLPVPVHIGYRNCTL